MGKPYWDQVSNADRGKIMCRLRKKMAMSRPQRGPQMKITCFSLDPRLPGFLVPDGDVIDS